MNDELNQLQTQKDAFETTMERIRKCKDLPETDLHGKYRTAYAQLTAQAWEQANEVKTILLFGGFQIRPSCVQAFADALRSWATSDEGIRMQRRASKAVQAGDAKCFYEEIVEIRAAVRTAAKQAGAAEDAYFRMIAEAIE